MLSFDRTPPTVGQKLPDGREVLKWHTTDTGSAQSRRQQIVIRFYDGTTETAIVNRY